MLYWINVDGCFIGHTHIHGLLWGIWRDTPEHDTGQHGAEQQRKTAGDTLHSCKITTWGTTDYREPDVTITEIFCSLHEEQITVKCKDN